MLVLVLVAGARCGRCGVREDGHVPQTPNRRHIPFQGAAPCRVAASLRRNELRLKKCGATPRRMAKRTPSARCEATLLSAGTAGTGEEGWHDGDSVGGDAVQ